MSYVKNIIFVGFWEVFVWFGFVIDIGYNCGCFIVFVILKFSRNCLYIKISLFVSIVLIL